MSLIVIIKAFFSLFVIDLISAVYIKQIQNNNPIFAGVVSVIVFVLYALLVIDFVNDHWLLIPAAAGGFTGVVVGVYINKRLEKK